MLTVYRQLLRLYPAAHRRQFGDEMLAVFTDARADNAGKKLLAQTTFLFREIVGLVRGAFGERLRIVLGSDCQFSLPTRSFVMQNGFRFPKATAVLMTIILGGVVLAIKKGQEIATSFPHVNPPIAPIHPAHSTVSPIVLLTVMFYAVGLVGWGILFAFRRSGVHRLAQMSEGHK